VLCHLLLDNPAMSLPVLECLSLLTVAESGRSEAFQVAVAALPVVSEKIYLFSLELCLGMWLWKRKPCKRGYEFKLLDQSQDAANGGDDDPMGMAAHAVLSSFKDSSTGSVLVQSYTKIREANAAADESPGSLLLDLLVLLALSERADFAMPQTRLWIHAWRPTSPPLTDYKSIAHHLR
jgi:hypothetical protein